MGNYVRNIVILLLFSLSAFGQSHPTVYKGFILSRDYSADTVVGLSVLNTDSTGFAGYQFIVNDDTCTFQVFNDSVVLYCSDTLEIRSTISYPTGAVNGYILKGDANGVVSWIEPHEALDGDTSFFELGAGTASLKDKRSTTGSGDASFTVGLSATNSGTHGIVIGTSANNGSVSDGIVLGQNGANTAESGIAIGVGATNSGDSGMALGKVSNNAYNYSIALGVESATTAPKQLSVSDSITTAKFGGATNVITADSVGNIWGINAYSGWATYEDTSTNSGAKFALTANDTINLPFYPDYIIDSQLPLDIDSLFSRTDSTIIGRNGDAYAVTIEFQVQQSTASDTKVTTWIDIGGGVGPLYERSTSYTKGLNEIAAYLSSFDAYTLNTWQTNGGRIKVTSDQNVNLYDMRVIIFRTHKAR